MNSFTGFTVYCIRSPLAVAERTHRRRRRLLDGPRSAGWRPRRREQQRPAVTRERRPTSATNDQSDRTWGRGATMQGREPRTRQEWLLTRSPLVIESLDVHDPALRGRRRPGTPHPPTPSRRRRHRPPRPPGTNFVWRRNAGEASRRPRRASCCSWGEHCPQKRRPRRAPRHPPDQQECRGAAAQKCRSGTAVAAPAQKSREWGRRDGWLRGLSRPCR